MLLLQYYQKSSNVTETTNLTENYYIKKVEVGYLSSYITRRELSTNGKH